MKLSRLGKAVPDFERNIGTEMKPLNSGTGQTETKQTETKRAEIKRAETKRTETRLGITISDETIEEVGILAKLELDAEEREQAKKDMGEMLAYIDKLNELDTSGIEPMFSAFPTENVFREDIAVNGDGSEAALANAPEKKNGCFQVPKTIA